MSKTPQTEKNKKIWLGYHGQGKVFSSADLIGLLKYAAVVSSSNGINNKKVQVITKDKIMTQEDSGKTYGIDTSAGDVLIELPDTPAGISFEFVVVVANGNNNFTIMTTGDSSMFGSGSYTDGTEVASDDSTILFQNAVIGDTAILKGVDDNKWGVTAHSGAATISFPLPNE